jgi:peptidoglycan/LPS O-acetylase OafA/YrhL
VAVSLVVVYHVWPGSLTGGYTGVDVFFVISGFLITSHLVTAEPSRGRDLVTFWMRRVRRLLPAALLVLATTLVLSRLLAPSTLWKDTALGAVASALYVENWRLAGQAVDYLAAENAPTPVQHYWSLSVEEQFYAFWPILVLACVLLARRLGVRMVPVLGVVLAVVVAGSLAYSVQATAADPSSAYFVTPTRVWELGIGGLVAVLVAFRRPAAGGSEDGGVQGLPAPLRSLMAWAGFAAIAWAGWTYTDATPFPGSAALVPVLGTALVIAAAASGVGSPTWVLSSRPVQWLGDVSYSVYLWHWPVIVLLGHVSGSRGVLDATAALALTLVLAGLTKRYVEDRFRGHPRGTPLWRPFAAAAVAMSVVVGMGVAQGAEVDQRRSEARAEVRAALSGDDPCFGARALDPRRDCSPVQGDTIIPDPAQAAEDKSDAYADDCWEYRPFDKVVTCEYGDPDADVSIALVGNSHAGHWLPALQDLARQRGWRITTFLASQCFPTDVTLQLETRRFERNCRAWGEKVRKATAGSRFDLVITSNRTGRAPVGADDDEEAYEGWFDGYRSYVRDWLQGGTRLLVVRDNPFPMTTIRNIPDCVAEHEDDLAACEGSRKDWLLPDPMADAVRDLDAPGASVADLTSFFCRDETCYPVIGGALAYFDSSHISATYARTLAPYLEPYVVRALEAPRP